MIKQREAGYQGHSVAKIVREICALADGCTMSALKDFSVSAGGFIGTRDEAAYQKAAVQCFLDGIQPAGVTLAVLAVALEELLSCDAWAANRVEQVHYLWRRLKDRIPVLHPAGGHGVFIDTSRFLAQIPKNHFAAEALAAFIFEISGIRLTKGPPLAPSQRQRGLELLRLAVPARRYLQSHMDDVAEALLCAYEHRKQIKALRTVEKAGRPGFAPALFALINE